MCEFFLAGWNIEDERSKAIAHVARDFVRDLLVTADKVGTESLIVLEWPHPVDALDLTCFFDHLRQLLMPHRIGNTHSHLMRELPLAVAGETFVCNAPRFFTCGARDDADADAGFFAFGFDVGLGVLAGLGYFTAVAPTARAAARPASDDPDIRIPGNSSGGSGGVIRRLS